jgi:predicted transcriptional regulator
MLKDLKDEFNELQDTLIDRQIAQEDRAIKQGAIKYSQEKRFLKGRLDDENFDFQEFKKSNEYTSLTREGKEFAETYYGLNQVLHFQQKIMKTLKIK